MKKFNLANFKMSAISGFKIFNIVLLLSLITLLSVNLFYQTKKAKPVSQFSAAEKREAVRMAYLESQKKAEVKKAVMTTREYEVRADNHKIEISKPEIKRIVKINRRVILLDFSKEVNKNVVNGDFIVAKGSQQMLRENTVIRGNLYVMNMNSNYKLPKGVKVEGHLFVKNARSVSLNHDTELKGNVYIYEGSALTPVAETTKIDGQIIL